MSSPSRVILWSGALVLVLILLALLGAASRLRGGLHQYEADLRAQGEKLSFAELTSGRKPNGVDSHAIVTNIAAKLSGARLSPGSLELRRFIQPGKARVTWERPELTWSQSAGTSSNGTWEDLDAQMNAAQSTLQETRQALKEPAADAGPCTNMLASRRVNFVAIRTVAQWLMGATENELHHGRLEGALQDLEALAGLANMERDEPTLVAQMVRVAVAGLGLTVTWEALQAPGWTDPQLDRLQKAWAPVDLVAALEKGFAGERACGCECFAQIRRSSGPQTGRMFSTLWGTSSSKAVFENLMLGYVYMPAYKLAWINEDQLFYLKTMQESLAAPRLLRAHRPWLEATQSVAKVGARLNNLNGWSDKFRYFFSLMAIPNFTRASERAAQVETERQMTLAAIGLKRYQLRHGELPPNLEALAPEFLPVLPYDPMSGKSLCYHLKGDGGFVLYSVGEDGEDDGGDSNPRAGGRFDLWQGRDAVWPVRVEE